MQSILRRIKEQAVTLSERDDVHTFFSHFGEPASEESIEKAGLPAELAALYRNHNGLVIAWTPKGAAEWEDDEPAEGKEVSQP